MKLFRIFTAICIFFGDSMVISSQSLLGAVENILGLDDGPSDNQRYTSAPPQIPNVNNYAVRNNLLGSNPNLYTRDPNRRVNNNLSNNKLQNGFTNPTINFLNQQNPSRVQNNVMNKVNQGNYEDEDVKAAAQQFPALQKLLERLKELNRQKELEKQKSTGLPTEATTTTTSENNNDSPDESKLKDEKFKAMTKRKFYFQVRPVVPESERKDKDKETVYYEE